MKIERNIRKTLIKLWTLSIETTRGIVLTADLEEERMMHELTLLAMAAVKGIDICEENQKIVEIKMFQKEVYPAITLIGNQIQDVVLYFLERSLVLIQDGT